MTAAIGRAIAALGLTLVALAASSQTFAQATPGVASELRQAEADVRGIERRATATMPDADRVLVRARLSTARQAAAAVEGQVSSEIVALDARIAELGPARAEQPPPGGPA